MGYTSKIHEGYCMRCSWPDYDTRPVAIFYLGGFQARLCIEHTRGLIEELTNWSRDKSWLRRL